MGKYTGGIEKSTKKIKILVRKPEKRRELGTFNT